MRTPSNHSATWVWLLLCVATAGSAWLGSGADSGSTAQTLAGVSVLGIAMAKVVLVMGNFMELQQAPRAWQAVFVGWASALLAVLIWLYVA